MERVMEQSVEEKEEVKGTSREPGALAGVYEVLSQRAIDEAIRIGVEAGTRDAWKRAKRSRQREDIPGDCTTHACCWQITGI